jgi:acetylornithine deacetylase
MCTEGSSGHSSSEQLYKQLVPRPAAAVLTVGTQNKITLGNRGRVDVRIRIAGKASHSSAPELGVNPIAYLPDIIDRITHFELDITPHPLLGRRAITIYSLTCGPTAPHTTPIECRLTIDRRLLPGDSLEHAVDEIRTILRGLPVEVEVTMGPHMLPVLIAPETAVIERLVASARQVTTELDLTYPSWTFDAGYPASIGIPAIMFGPSTSDTSGAEVMTDDYVTEAAVLEAANVYAAMMFSERNTA